MKKMLFIASALFLTSGFALAQNENQQIPYVSINSSADTLVTPNKFEVAITISEEPSKGKITLAEQENSLAKALKAAGVDLKKQLVITGQSSADGKRKDIYQYKNYRLTLTEPEMVEATFNELQKNGIGNVQLTKCTRSDLNELQAVVRVKAMKNAQQTASELAMALGQKIGKAFQIEAWAATQDQIMIRGLAASKSGNAMMEDSAMPELKFNDVRVQQNVTVRFILE